MTGRPAAHTLTAHHGVIPKGKEVDMPLYLIERNFAEELALTGDLVAAGQPVLADTGNRWLFSFLSADKKKMYCLYESEDADAVREAARRLDFPADVVIEVTQVRPEAFA
jgi:Protein of unknown function (DUF4242)